MARYSESRRRVERHSFPIILSMRPNDCDCHTGLTSIPCDSIPEAMALARKAICHAWCISVMVNATGEFGWYDTPERQFVKRSWGLLVETDPSRMILLAQSKNWI